jgi:hypothetical protein
VQVLSRYAAAARVLWPFVLAATGLLVLIIATTFFVNSEGFGYDFLAYERAARRIALGESPYLPNTVGAFAAGLYEGLYLYPPNVAVALLPFTVVDEQTATLIWMALRLGMLVIGCLLLPISFRVRLATLGVAGLSFPVLFDLNLGNVSIVIFGLCAVAWRWIGSPWAAVAHAALAFVRFPFLDYGLLWIVQRRFRTLAMAIGVGVAMILVAIPIVGLAAHAEYIAILRDLPDICSGPHFLCWESSVRSAGFPEAVAALATAASYACGLAAIVAAGLRRDESTAFVVTAMVTMLVTPFIHPHYLVLLLLPAAYLMDRGFWWAMALPLLGWLPDVVLPFTSLLAIVLVLALSSHREPGEQRVA